MTQLYQTFIDQMLQQLGVSTELQRNCQLPLQVEAAELVSAGPDIFGREQTMTATTLHHWAAMQAAAADANVILQLVSAFRSVDYQCQLIRNKLDRGQCFEDIFKVSAIPGYSEHHTGRALDLTSPGSKPLEETFELTDAFAWLQANARHFDFSLSYPPHNSFGIAYEPWHWYCAAG
jgi:D-alanyl-D-alanine carboxypeptidase